MLNTYGSIYAIATFPAFSCSLFISISPPPSPPREQADLLITTCYGTTTTSRQMSSSASPTSCVTPTSAVHAPSPTPPLPTTLIWWPSELATISRRERIRGLQLLVCCKTFVRQIEKALFGNESCGPVAQHDKTYRE